MTTDLRPRTWSEYIGQDKLKDQLEVFIADASADQRPLGHLFLHAEPGYGKSALAALIADTLQDPFYEMTMPIDTKALMSFFNKFGGGVVLFDEFHLLTDRAQEALFIDPLGDSSFTTPNGRRIEIPWFTAIIATSQPEKVLPSVRRRIPISNLSFDAYTSDELGRVVRGMATKLGFDLDVDVADGIGHATGGRPGQAMPLIYAARALAKQGPLTIERVLEFCEIDPDGITKEHRKLLSAIDKLAGLGHVGLERLADYSGVNGGRVRELERLMFDLELISYGAGGRELTATGIARVRGVTMKPMNGGNFRQRGAA